MLFLENRSFVLIEVSSNFKFAIHITSRKQLLAKYQSILSFPNGSFNVEVVVRNFHSPKPFCKMSLVPLFSALFFLSSKFHHLAT